MPHRQAVSRPIRGGTTSATAAPSPSRSTVRTSRSSQGRRRKAGPRWPVREGRPGGARPRLLTGLTRRVAKTSPPTAGAAAPGRMATGPPGACWPPALRAGSRPSCPASGRGAAPHRRRSRSSCPCNDEPADRGARRTLPTWRDSIGGDDRVEPRSWGCAHTSGVLVRKRCLTRLANGTWEGTRCRTTHSTHSARMHSTPHSACCTAAPSGCGSRRGRSTSSSRSSSGTARSWTRAGSSNGSGKGCASRSATSPSTSRR